jgi:hypothetical protein
MGRSGERNDWAGMSHTTGRHFPDGDVILGDSLRLLDLLTLLVESSARAQLHSNYLALRSN